MPRFYFHLSDGGFVSDNRGQLCKTRKDAEAYAVNVAAEYGRNRDHISKDLSVVVTDEMGKEVFRAPVVDHSVKVKAKDIVDTLRSGEGDHEDAK
jgi:hypothetical protein